MNSVRPLKIAVAGATGTLGRHVMAEALRHGHDTVPLSRSSGVDLLDGTGLAEALGGCSAVIDCTSTSRMSARASTDFFTTVTRTLLQAERRAGVGHHVAISIIGAAEVPANYYAGKAAQERMLLATRDPACTILRTTQFHEFAGQIATIGRAGSLHVVPRMRSQPIAAREVASELVRIAADRPLGATIDLAGPQEESMAQLVRRLLRADGERRLVVEVPLAGAWGRGMRDGSLLPAPGTRLGRQTFGDWLAERRT